MRALLLVFLGLLPQTAWAQERPPDIDPNTKIQGGADVRGSGANAGAGTGANAPSDKKMETKTPREADKSGPEKDKPISERKPEDASRGENTPKQNF